MPDPGGSGPLPRSETEWLEQRIPDLQERVAATQWRGADRSEVAALLAEVRQLRATLADLSDLAQRPWQERWSARFEQLAVELEAVRAERDAARQENERLETELTALRRELLDETYRPEGGEIVLRELRAAKRERDALAAQLAAVRAVPRAPLSEPENVRQNSYHRGWGDALNAVAAALAAPVDVPREDFGRWLADQSRKAAAAKFGGAVDVPREPWRVGRRYGIHVYEGDRPVATFLSAADAHLAVLAHNAYRVVDVPREDEEARDGYTEMNAHGDGKNQSRDWEREQFQRAAVDVPQPTPTCKHGRTEAHRVDTDERPYVMRRCPGPVTATPTNEEN